MEKDNRSLSKRKKMRQMKQQFHRAPGTERFESVIDVADSSDDVPKSWKQASKVAPQYRNPRDPIDDEFDDNPQLNAGDFHTLSQCPVGGHFKFSSEKNWDMEGGEQLLDNTEASEYFTLNLKLLNAGVKTIPFYKRVDYPASMFTNKQIKMMENEADIAEKTYQNILKEHNENPHARTKSANQRSGSGENKSKTKITAAPATATATATATSNKTNEIDDLDELLSLTTDKVEKVSINTKTTNGKNRENIPKANNNTNSNKSINAEANKDKEDIQNWLDNILEDTA